MKKSLLIFLLCSLLLGFQTKQITWVAIGDSITYLNEHKDETGNRITAGFLTRVTSQLTNFQYINKGYNGWTVMKIAAEIESLGIPKADVFTIFLGTNDWWHGNPLGNIEDYKNNTGANTGYGAFRVIINKIRSLNPSAKIVLITPMQRADFVYIANYRNNAYGSYKIKDGQNLEQFAAAVNAIGKFEHITVLDLYHLKEMSIPHLVKFKRLKDPATGQYRNYGYPDYTSIPFNPDTDAYPYPVEAIDMTYDGLHPSDKGYALIAEKLVSILKKY
jgi:lysophospholipase L1-like esterase